MSPRSGASTPRGTSTTHHQYSPPAARTPRVAPTPRSPNPYTPRRSTGGYTSSPQHDGEYDRHRKYEAGYGRTSSVPQSPPYSPGYSSPEHSPQMDVRAEGRHYQGGDHHVDRYSQGGDHHHIDESTETPGGWISPNEQTLDELDFSPYAQKQIESYRAPHSPSPAHYSGERSRLTGACTPSCGANGRKCPHVSCDTAPCRRFPNKGMTFGESGFLDQADYSRPSPRHRSRDY